MSTSRQRFTAEQHTLMIISENDGGYPALAVCLMRAKPERFKLVESDAMERHEAGPGKIRQLSDRARLVGSLNRVGLLVRLERAVDCSKRYGFKTALLYVDIDRPF